MNSQKYKIQALIAEIDEVLSKPVPRLPWTGSIDLVHQRQLLERVRTHLVSPDSKLVVSPKQANSPKSPPPPIPVPKVPLATTNQKSATQQILQAVTGEISHLRESLTGPLEADIQTLRAEQQALVQEIKQLEAKRQQQQSLAQQQANQQQIISEFLQAVTSRLPETLVGDFSATSPRNLQNQSLGSGSDSLDLYQQPPLEHPLLTSAERLEVMQRFEVQTDRLLMRLDSTMNIVFEALQGNLETYQGSLSQGLERMHGLGQQSEIMFTALVNHLAEELGREASSYVQQPTIDLSNQNATSTSQMLSNTAQIQLTGETPIAEVAIEYASKETFQEQERFPYAGTELSPQFGELRRDRTSTSISLPDLEENFFSSAPQIDQPKTTFPGAESEPDSAETNEDVEDVYANLFLEEEVAELDLEDFIIENTATATEIELVPSETQPVNASYESLNNSEDLFSNLVDDEDLLPQRQSISNRSGQSLNTQDLFASILGEEDFPPNTLNADDSVEDFIESPPTATETIAQTNIDHSNVAPEDVYIHASPDENLLPVEQESEKDVDRSLNLDNDVLEQLESDLYSLEGLPNSSPGRSQPSAILNSGFLVSASDSGAENPFAELAEEELGTLEDLFPDMLELSSEDEMDEFFTLEEELDVELLAEDEEENVSLDDILASLIQTDPTSPETSQETNKLRSNSPESQKKN